MPSQPLSIAIIGAGAIGGYVGVKLALAGEDVTFIVPVCAVHALVTEAAGEPV